MAVVITGNHQQVDSSPVGPKITKAVPAFLVSIYRHMITPKLNHAVLETTSKAKLALLLVQPFYWFMFSIWLQHCALADGFLGFHLYIYYSSGWWDKLINTGMETMDLMCGGGGGWGVLQVFLFCVPHILFWACPSMPCKKMYTKFHLIKIHFTGIVYTVISCQRR